MVSPTPQNVLIQPWRRLIPSGDFPVPLMKTINTLGLNVNRESFSRESTRPEILTCTTVGRSTDMIKK
jgi:hypothetical protein